MQKHTSEGRRGFLRAMAAGTTVALAGVTSRGETESRTRSNQGIIFKAVKGGGIGKDKASMLNRLNDLKQLGFDGIEGGSPGIRDTQVVREAVLETGMPVHGVVDGVHWNQRLSSPDSNVRDAGREALAQAIRVSHAIGGSSVLLVPGKVTGDDEHHDHVWERSIQEIRKVLPLASRLGIHVLIETVWNGFCYDPEQFRDYLDAIDSPWVRAYFDIGNMQKFAPAHQWIRVLGSRIVKLDVKDWGQANGFCRLGEGDVDWAEVRKALREIGFTGWATREGNDGGQAITARLMNELLDL